MMRTQSNFWRPTQEASFAPRGSTTWCSSDNSNKDTLSTQNLTQNQSGISTPVWSNTQGRNQQQQWVNNDPYAHPNFGKCFWCNQPSHLSNNCLNKQSVNLQKKVAVKRNGFLKKSMRVLSLQEEMWEKKWRALSNDFYSC